MDPPVHRLTSPASNEINVGQLVILTDEIQPRGKWKLGRVVRADTDADNLVRTVEVFVGDRTMKRDVTKVVALELD